MNLLLDTHALLWWLDDSAELAGRARGLIADPENTVFLSAVVIWELRIKEALGKVELPERIRPVLEEQPFVALPVTLDHAHAIADLPPLHRDPFDRMLVAQALCEGFAIVTRDPSISAYGVATVEA